MKVSPLSIGNSSGVIARVGYPINTERSYRLPVFNPQHSWPSNVVQVTYLSDQGVLVLRLIKDPAVGAGHQIPVLGQTQSSHQYFM